MSELNEFIPFHSLEEIEYHLSCSEKLIDIIKSNIEEQRKAKKIDPRVLDRRIIKSLEVLNSGFSNMITSIKEGYIK